MSMNKTQPTEASVSLFLEGISDEQREGSLRLIDIMREVSGHDPVLWGPSIIGFGSTHYVYDSGHEGDMPQLAFSPRSTALTIYLEGFDEYDTQLKKLGKYRLSKACLYIRRLADIDIDVLREMLQLSFTRALSPNSKPTTVEEYVASISPKARPLFSTLRELAKETLPHANEVFSYGIIGYKVDDKRARVYISGWKNHVALYPIPRSEQLQEKLKSYIKGKGTLWFNLDEPLPESLIKEVILDLAS